MTFFTDLEQDGYEFLFRSDKTILPYGMITLGKMEMLHIYINVGTKDYKIIYSKLISADLEKYNQNKKNLSLDERCANNERHTQYTFWSFEDTQKNLKEDHPIFKILPNLELTKILTDKLTYVDEDLKQKLIEFGYIQVCEYDKKIVPKGAFKLNGFHESVSLYINEQTKDVKIICMAITKSIHIKYQLWSIEKTKDKLLPEHPLILILNKLEKYQELTVELLSTSKKNKTMKV